MKIPKTLLSLLLPLSLIAQIDSFKLENKIHKNLGNGSFFRLFAQKDDQHHHLVFQTLDQSFTLQKLDAQFNPSSSQILSVSANRNLHEICQNKDYFLFNFMSNNRPEYFLINAKNQTTKSFSPAQAPSLRFPPQMAKAHEDNGFILVQAPRRAKKSQPRNYLVEHRDTLFDLVWEQRFDCLSSYHVIDKIHTSKNFVHLLEDAGRIGANKIIRLDAQTGQILYQTLLPTDKKFRISVEHILEQKDGALVLLAQLHHNNGTNNGFSVLKLDNQGKLNQIKHFPPADLIKHPAQILSTTRGTRLWVHAFEPLPNGRFTLIAEQYIYSKPSDNEHRLVLLPFMQLELNAELEIIKARSINKIRQDIRLLENPSSLNAGQSTSTALSGQERLFFRDLPLSFQGKMLKKYGLFSYQDFRILSEDEFILSFLSFDSDYLKNPDHYAYYLHIKKDSLTYYEQKLWSNHLIKLSPRAAELRFRPSSNLFDRIEERGRIRLGFADFQRMGIVAHDFDKYFTYGFFRRALRNGFARFPELELELIPSFWLQD